MNERIKTLSKQAGFFEDYGFFADQNNDKIEKFAELIIQECAQIAEETDGNYNAKRCVLEHFGVDMPPTYIKVIKL
jgi:hypothetical protein